MGALERNVAFVPFVVLLHLGTAAALAVFYRDDWARVVRAFTISAVRGRLMRSPDEHLAWMLFFGTIPAGVLGAVFESPLKTLFATPLVASALLVVNGGIMLLGERLRRAQDTAGRLTFRGEEPEGKRSIADLGWRDAVAVGSAQALALFPGISRSGATMCAGLLINMRHDEAARYTFMLATPLIAAAGLLEVPTLFTQGAPAFAIFLVGGVLSAIGLDPRDIVESIRRLFVGIWNLGFDAINGEFNQRTVSRLHEMQSATYLQSERRRASGEVAGEIQGIQAH